LAVSLTLAVRIGTIAYTKLYDRRWVDRPPVGLVPYTTPDELSEVEDNAGTEELKS